MERSFEISECFRYLRITHTEDETSTYVLYRAQDGTVSARQMMPGTIQSVSPKLRDMTIEDACWLVPKMEGRSYVRQLLVKHFLENEG